MAIPTIKHLFFIDSNVADFEALVKQLPADSTWFVLASDSDGVEQVANATANHSNLDSIQIISHGSAGSLYLGDTTLNSQNIDAYASQLEVIGASLSRKGDLLLYGCNVAQGEIGQYFINGS